MIQLGPSRAVTTMKVDVITCSPSAPASAFLEVETCDQTVSVDVLTGDGSYKAGS